MKTTGNTPIEFLTKREYFAAMAMQGMLANRDIINDSMESTPIEYTAVVLADQLIKELNTESDEGNEV